MNVVVADDDVTSRLMLQAAVEDLGHECLMAADGNQAWKLFVETSPDVLIADRMMPGLDGLELCRRVRAHAAASYTYVILATSLGEREDVLEGMETGADDYLIKPLDPFDLETRLVAARRVTALHAELAEHRAELDRLASTDPLTGLRNRRSLEEDLATLHVRSRRYRRAYCIVMCDVDHFKDYNDRFGHPAGDEVLRAVGAALRAEIREGDDAYRYGGEEFLLLLPEQTLESGTVVGERARQAVEKLRMPERVAFPDAVVSISVGVAALTPSHERSETAVLEAADEALYRAKKSGRNQVAS